MSRSPADKRPRRRPRAHPHTPAYALVARLLAAVACAAALLGAITPVARAVTVCVPPGASGVSQYFETVPGASCNQPPGTGARRGGGRLPPATARKLASQGPVGASVAQLVSSSGTAPPARAADAHHDRTARSYSRQSANAGGDHAPASRTGPPSPTVKASGPLTAILHPIISASGGGGGPLLAYLLAAVALVIAALALARARQRRKGQ